MIHEKKYNKMREKEERSKEREKGEGEGEGEEMRRKGGELPWCLFNQRSFERNPVPITEGPNILGELAGYSKALLFKVWP